MNRFDFIETSMEENGVAVIYLNRPRQLNSLNRKMVSEIVVAMEEYDRDDNVRVIVLTGRAVLFQRERILMK